MDPTKATIAVIGRSYVGLPLAVEFGRKRPVVGFDIKRAPIADLSGGHDATLEVEAQELASAGLLRFTAYAADLADCSIFFVTVPTLSDAHKQHDLTPLLRASDTISKVLNRGNIAIYEITGYLGPTEEDCVPVIERMSTLWLNEGFFAGCSPEQINPGDKTHRLTHTRKVTSGSTPEVAAIVDNLYASIITLGTYLAEFSRVAEPAKVIENTQPDLNMDLVNELAIALNRFGIDIDAVFRAADMKRTSLPFRPGLVGGHCIGVDSYYLPRNAAEICLHPKVIHADWRLINMIVLCIAGRMAKAILYCVIQSWDDRVLVMGLNFGEDCPILRNTRVSDTVRESQSFGINVGVHAPWEDTDGVRHEFRLILQADMQLGTYDGVLVAVAHRQLRAAGSVACAHYAAMTAYYSTLRKSLVKKTAICACKSTGWGSRTGSRHRTGK